MVSIGPSWISRPWLANKIQRDPNNKYLRIINPALTVLYLAGGVGEGLEGHEGLGVGLHLGVDELLGGLELGGQRLEVGVLAPPPLLRGTVLQERF